jgi:hypothetical protein
MRKRRTLTLCALLVLTLFFGTLFSQASPPIPGAPPSEESASIPTDLTLPEKSREQAKSFPADLDAVPLQTLRQAPLDDLALESKLRLRAEKELAQEPPALSASSYPNLRPHAPSGWSYPVTPSSAQGTSRVNALYAGQPTYFDWTVLNDSAIEISARFYVYLYLDGARIASWYIDGLSARWYAYARDWAYTVETPGWHTLRLVADAAGNILEENELDNTWQLDFYWESPASTRPNLRPFQPGGWSAPIVPSAVLGGNAPTALYVGQPTYIDWAIQNNSSLAVNTRIQSYLYLDDVRVASWYTDGLLPNWSAYVLDWALTVQTPGWHTLRLVTDAANAVQEMDETDNVYEARFFWQDSGQPNLRLYTPLSWSAPVVLSAAPGTTTNSALYAGKPIYIDWAVLNDSGADINKRFYHYLYLDGQRIASWHTDLLLGHWYTLVSDWSYTVQTPGWHRFMLVTDATSAIGESDEGDNVWEGAFWFDAREERTAGAVWVNGYYRSGLMPLSFNDANARGFLNELGRVGWLKAFQWGDESAWEKDFKDARWGGMDHLVVDGVTLVYFSGHGSRTGLRFDTLQDDFELTYEEAYWGNGSLNWLVADSCQVLNNDDGAAIARWGRAFGGLHALLGFDTPCHDLPQRGENFARYADGSYWWTGALPLKDAWFQAAAITEDSSTYSAALIATQSAIDPSNDYLPGVGSYSADPVAPTRFYLWRVQN